MSRLKLAMQFFLSELHARNCRFQPCAFLKFRKISETTPAVKILFYRTDTYRFALQNTCSKQFCGKLPGRSVNVLKKDSKTYENSKIFYNIFYVNAETSKWPFLLL